MLILFLETGMLLLDNKNIALDIAFSKFVKIYKAVHQKEWENHFWGNKMEGLSLMRMQKTQNMLTHVFRAIYLMLNLSNAKGPTYKPLSSSNCQACICKCHLVRIPQCGILMG